MTCRVLVADDSTPIQKVIKIAFSKYAVEITTATSLMDAIKESERLKPDILIADAGLPGISAASDFLKLTSKLENVPVVILMGSYESVREADLRAANLSHIVKKPFDAMELLNLVEGLVPGKFSLASSATASKRPPAPPNPMMDLSDMSAMDTPALELNFVPPVPMTEPMRKGRPAFDNVIPTAPNEISPSFGVSEPPPSSNAPHGFTGVVGTKTEFVPPPPPKRAAPPPPMSTPMSAEQSPPSFIPLPTTITPLQNHGAPSSVSGVSAAVEEFVRRELPALVDQAVERYCAEHFKGMAREVLTTELRRLAEEKTRYLVDQ